MLCGSWIVVNRETEKPVMELFSPRRALIVAQTFPDKVRVFCAYDWLTRLNQRKDNNAKV